VPIAAWIGVLTIVQLLAAVIGRCAVAAVQRRRHGLPAEPGRARTAGPRQCDPGIDRRGDRGDRPPIGRVLVQTVTAPLALLIDALSYLASALLLLRVRQSEPPAEVIGSPSSACRTSPRAWRSFGITDPAAAALARVHPYALRRHAGSVLCALCDQHLGVLAPVMGRRHRLRRRCVIRGAALVPWLNARLPVGFGDRRLPIKSVGLAMLPLAACCRRDPPLLVLQQVVQDSVTSYFSVNERSLRQKADPHQQLARAAATVRGETTGRLPLGALIAGLLAQVVQRRCGCSG